MADETMYGTHGFLSIVREGKVENWMLEVYTLSVGGDTAKAGMVLTQDDATDQSKIVDLAVTTDENFVGILYAPVTPDDDYDLDDAISDGEEVYVLKPTGGRLKVATFLEATAGPVAVNRGENAVLGTEAGKLRKFAYADASSETDTLEERVGTFAEYDAGSADDDHIVLINY